MQKRSGFSLIFSFVLFFFPLTFALASSSAHDFETVELTGKIVQKKMNEVLQSHCLYHELEIELVKRQSKDLIEWLDPAKLYFLEKEIADWTNPSDARLKKLKDQWRQGDFSEIEKLATVMKKAISRRLSLEKNLNTSLELSEQEAQKAVKKLNWSKDEQELQEHLSLMHFLEDKLLSHWEEDKRPLAKERLKKQREEFESYFTQSMPGLKNPAMHYMLESYLRMFAQSLDAHTLYFTAKEAKEFTSSINRKITGIGVLLRDNLDGYRIVRIIEGSPTERSGKIQVGDRIIAVDAIPVIGLDLSSKGIHLIQGSKGSPVQITLQRDPPKNDKQNTPPLTFEVTLTRDDIVLQDSRFKTRLEPFGNGVIGVIELYSFYADEKSGCAEDVKNQILEMKQKGNLQAVVLDLRHNLGGLLVQAVELSGLFLHPGAIVSAKDSTGQVQTLRQLKNDPVWEGPLFVLISKSSASSSEIVAAALQDWGRALILGDPHSFGKGSFFVFPLNTKKWDPTGVFSITQGLYYTASGKSPQFDGVKSDISVPGPMASLEIGEKTLKYPLPSSQIGPKFKDDLSDVGLLDKRYLEKAYLPFVPEPTTFDLSLIETLRKNSQIRQSQSPYSASVKEEAKEGDEESSQENIESNLRAVQSQWQLQECLNIVKDWLLIQQHLTQQAA